MSHVKLTLRPPPNVDFINGYPGIPPAAPNRPQAAVNGALEVRATPAVRAKWVKVELRKVEMLPGASANNTFNDSVGQGPVTLWNPDEGEEYSELGSLDFPFSIRIPESLPPSLILENRGGIKYELLATVGVKGKSRFLRRRKDVVITAQTPLLIDKHELHSTWPVYCQPEARQVQQEGVTLIVERQNTCYGPGDRIAVSATVKSDATHTIILRGFELTLRESMTFRPGRQTGPVALPTRSKSASPQVLVSPVTESKLPVNATLYGGMSHKSELSCQISPNHTTATLTAARHIDITYVITIKALMGTGTHLMMDLPVILSNWQRNVSQEAVRRIGPVPNLSLTPSSSTATTGSLDRAPILSQTISGFSDASSAHGRNNSTSSNNLSSTLAKTVDDTSRSHKPSGSKTNADEFGVRGGGGLTVTVGGGGSTGGGSSSRPSTSNGGRRPGSAGGAGGGGNRFSVVNPTPSESLDIAGGSNAVTSSKPVISISTATPVLASASSRPWPTAEEEKERYERAKSQAEKTQNAARAKVQAQTQPTTSNPKPPATTTVTSSSRQRPAWPSAEEEKEKERLLFEKAQAAVRKTHGLDRSDSVGTTGSNASSGAAAPSQKLTSNFPQYDSAEQEKIALRRYYEAKQAVDRTHAAYDTVSGPAPVNGLSGPVAYDSLYPTSMQAAVDATAPSDLPPPFELSSAPPPIKDAKTALEEKMRLKRAYEAQDAAAARNQQNGGVDQSPPYAAPPPSFQSSTIPPSTLSPEKEILKKRSEVVQEGVRPQPPPPRKGSVSSVASTSPRLPSRPAPTPPLGSRVLTAAEEKAMLRAKYATQEAQKPSPPPRAVSPPVLHLNGSGSVSPTPSVISASTPPPLMPRPPASYIQETQEEDARVSRIAMTGIVPPDELYLNGRAKLPVPPVAAASAVARAIREPGSPPLPTGEYY